MIDLSAYERHLLETARRQLQLSPCLNQTQKVIIERLFQQIDDTIQNKGGTYK